MFTVYKAVLHPLIGDHCLNLQLIIDTLSSMASTNILMVLDCDNYLWWCLGLVMMWVFANIIGKYLAECMV